jgi:hypothetical protein
MFLSEIEPCEGEVKVKEYKCAELEAGIFKTKKAKGFLTITNMRVVFRTKGYNDYNTSFIHSELPIENVSGVMVKKGIRLSIFTLILAISVAILYIGVALYTFISMYTGVWGYDIWKIFRVLILIVATIILLTLFIILGVVIFRKLKVINPYTHVLSLKITSKGGENGAINLEGDTEGFLLMDVTAEPVPTDEVMSMASEIGAIISDIQKTEDGMQKWIENAKKEELAEKKLNETSEYTYSKILVHSLEKDGKQKIFKDYKKMIDYINEMAKDDEKDKNE